MDISHISFFCLSVQHAIFDDIQVLIFIHQFSAIKMHNITWVPSDIQIVFYPIGNTPAVNLLSCQPLEAQDDKPTEILSLACGDARSILYSLWCEGRPSTRQRRLLEFKFANIRSTAAKHIHFTCCDLEPAVLVEIHQQSMWTTALTIPKQEMSCYFLSS